MQTTSNLNNQIVKCLLFIAQTVILPFFLICYSTRDVQI